MGNRNVLEEGFNIYKAKINPPLRHQHSHPIVYQGCTFYLQEKLLEIEGPAYFDNCTFRGVDDVWFSTKYDVAFINCGLPSNSRMCLKTHRYGTSTSLKGFPEIELWELDEYNAEHLIALIKELPDTKVIYYDEGCAGMLHMLERHVDVIQATLDDYKYKGITVGACVGHKMRDAERFYGKYKAGHSPVCVSLIRR